MSSSQRVAFFFSITGTDVTTHPAHEALYVCVRGAIPILQKGAQHKVVWGHQFSQVPAQRSSDLVHTSHSGEAGSSLWCYQHWQVGYQLYGTWIPGHFPSPFMRLGWLLG